MLAVVKLGGEAVLEWIEGIWVKFLGLGWQLKFVCRLSYYIAKAGLRNILIMSKLTALLLALLLLTSTVAQNTTPASTCGTSTVTGLASGLIYLGVPSASVAQTSFSQTLAGFNLGTFAEVFSAFAVAGIQASSTQQFYSLVVDTVVFSNGNTQMNVTLSYANPDGSFQTTWTKVKLSWVAVSTAMQTMDVLGGSYVWAGSVGLQAPFNNGLAAAMIPNSLWYQVSATADARCGYINTSPPFFDVACNGNANARFVTHLYIMGFQFDPSGTYSLAASVLRGGGTNFESDVDEALGTAGFTVRAVGGTDERTGPIMLIDTVGSQLRYLKVGIVITTILDINTYPTVNPAGFQYSGVYMTYTLFNVAQPIIKGARAVSPATPATSPGLFNYNYYGLINDKYQIFGLSAFYIAKLPAAVTVLNYDIDLSGDNQVLLNTDDVNYMTGVKISADKWNAVITSCTPTTTPMINLAQKLYNTVPPLKNSEQNIFETASLLTFNYYARGIYTDESPPLSTSVVYTNSLYFQNITAGMTYEITYSMTFPVVPGVTSTSPRQIQYSLYV